MFCSRCGTEYQDSAKFCPSCGLDLAATTPLAAVVDSSERTEVDQVRAALSDEYEILDELGRGGMAIVFKAREKGLDRDVAVKVLPFSLAFDSEFVERFQREARTASQLSHPSVVCVYDLGQREDGSLYIAMELVDGDPLKDLIDRDGPLQPERAVHLARQVLSGLTLGARQSVSVRASTSR